MNRTELEDAVWKLPRIQASGIDFADIESLTDAELLALLGKGDRPKKQKVKREPRKRYPSPRVASFEFVEREGRLMRLEKWQHWNAAGTYYTEVAAPTGAQVLWDDRRVSASIVLHWLRTGERVARVPRESKPFRALLRSGGKLVHLGYFASTAERDAAIFAYRLGVYPNGLK